MDTVERELGAAPSGGPFFLGPQLSLVDLTFAPFLERIAASILYYKGFAVRGQVGRWDLRCDGSLHKRCCFPPFCHKTWRPLATPGWLPATSQMQQQSSLPNVSLLAGLLLLLLLQGRWPHLERWFDAMEGRPAYAGFKSDYYTHCHDLPPQLGGCASGQSVN